MSFFVDCVCAVRVKRRMNEMTREIVFIVNMSESSLPATPQSLSNQRHVCIKSLGPELDRALLLSAHVSSHQQFCYFKSIVKTLFGLSSVEEALNEIAILGFVTILRRFIAQYRHQALFGILFFHQVFTRLTFHLTAQKQFQTTIE